MPVDARDEGPAHSDDDDREAEDAEDDDDDPATSKDAGTAKADASKGPAAAMDDETERARGAKDASVATTPDARTPTTAQDGGTSASSKDSGAPDATTTEPSGELCTLTRYQVPDAQPAGDGADFPVLEVNGGAPVDGAGCAQQWEGIVMTTGGRGLCTAAFISDRHLISASHCYAADGAVSLRVSAPTWDDGASHAFQARVTRSGSNQTLDVSIIDLGKSVEWATPERRFVLHAGKAASVDLHLYGFGTGGSSGAAGTLRGIPDRATLRVTDNGRGTLRGTAGPAQLCTGDSGGPAFVEKTAAVLYGINQAIVPAGFGGGRTCASSDWTIMFTNVSAYMPFIEQALGKTCERKRVDDLEVAQCW